MTKPTRRTRRYASRCSRGEQAFSVALKLRLSCLVQPHLVDECDRSASLRRWVAPLETAFSLMCLARSRISRGRSELIDHYHAAPQSCFGDDILRVSTFEPFRPTLDGRGLQ